MRIARDLSETGALEEIRTPDPQIRSLWLLINMAHLFCKPKSFVCARINGLEVILQPVVRTYDEKYGLATLEVEGGRFTVPMPSVPIGSRRRLTIAASAVSLARESPRATTVLNILPAAILSATSTGEHETVVLLGLGPAGTGSRLLARITRRSWDELGLAESMMIYAQVKSVALAPA